MLASVDVVLIVLVRVIGRTKVSLEAMKSVDETLSHIFYRGAEQSPEERYGCRIGVLIFELLLFPIFPCRE